MSNHHNAYKFLNVSYTLIRLVGWVKEKNNHRMGIEDGLVKGESQRLGVFGVWAGEHGP